MRLNRTFTAVIALVVAGPAFAPPPVVRTDGEIVTLVADIPVGGLFTDARGVLYVRSAPAFGEAELETAVGARVLCVRIAEGQGEAELIAGDNWAWPVLVGRLVVREQPPPRPWNAAEAAARTATAAGRRATLTSIATSPRP
jgi:hypothetical protein